MFPKDGDDITLVVNDPTKNWGVFDDPAVSGSGDTTCGDPLGGVQFSNCIDSAKGTIFKDATTNGFDITFYTDPGALQYLSETDPTGKVTVLAGKIPSTVPEPSSVWLLLAAAVITVAAMYKRRGVTVRPLVR